MKRIEVLLIIVMVFTFVFQAAVFASVATWNDISRGNNDVRSLAVDPINSKVIYIGTKSGVLKSENSGDSWRSIFVSGGENKSVNYLMFSPQDRSTLFAATGNGLFSSQNQGLNWKKIFKGRGVWENECTGLAIAGDVIYLGTKAGLFITKDRGRTWRKELTKLGSSYILSLVFSSKEPDFVYIACVDGVFRTTNSGQAWERVFSVSPTDNGNAEDYIEEDRDEEAASSIIRYLCIDPSNNNCLYLATSKGVYKSLDKGQSWDLVSSYGLLSQQVTFVAVSQSSGIYAVSKSRIFEYKDQSWKEISLGLAVKRVYYLGFDKQNNLYAACNNGLFKSSYESGRKTNEKGLMLYFKGEPDIRNVQQAAIRYAEVAPEKIKIWRKQAAKKAYLPQINVGVDRNVNDLWHWEGGSTTKADDDSLRKGKDALEWNVSLRWDLGELVWNDDQTSIDVRSRLMVQLRDDILDEVTKLYFERLRVKIEISNLDIIDVKKRLEKELRLQELTASIDALTGGYFSEQLKART